MERVCSLKVDTTEITGSFETEGMCLDLGERVFIPGLIFLAMTGGFWLDSPNAVIGQATRSMSVKWPTRTGHLLALTAV